MRTIWLGLSLTAVIVLFGGCSGGGAKSPPALSYMTGIAVYTKGVQIAANNPTSRGGVVTGYTVNPVLPAGLTLSASTGVINGTPTIVISKSSYTVIASGAGGSTTAALTITVNDQPPTALRYTADTPVYALRAAIAPNTPANSGGTVISYRVSPVLPAGLGLNTTTGIISGIPTTPTAAASYTVTATNSGGSTEESLNITAAKVVPAEAVMACDNLLQLDFPNTQIIVARLVEASSTPYPSPYNKNWGNYPPHCLVQGIVGARTGAPAPAMDQYGNLTPAVPSDSNYGVKFELRMPTATWNGDFFFTGGSGNDGLVQPAVGATLGGGNAFPPALTQGFAVVTQNSGHTAGADEFGQTAPDQNNGFGYDPEARYDYGYQQTGTITPIAKAIVASYYGIEPVFSYYLGCSNGGREAMVASQRWGDMFDGIVAGDPGFRLPHAAIAEAWDTQQFAIAAEAVAPGSLFNGNPDLLNAVSTGDLSLVGQLVLKTCDTLDNTQDDMIFNIAACRKAFDPASIGSLQCSGAKTPACLLAAQITAIQKVFQGPVDSQGNALYSDWPYDVGISDPKWMMWPVGIAPFPGFPGFIAANTTQGATSAKYLFSSPPDPSMNIFTVPMDTLNTGVNATSSTFTQSAVTYMEATSTDLDNFTAHNGKIIYFHGESDPVFSMYDTVSYYENLSTRYGSGTANFARLFLIPGMNHCSGGLRALDSFDPLAAIVKWVEEGTAPDSMLAGNSNPAGASTLLRTTAKRPLCPYPQFAQGPAVDTDDASQFKCINPAP